MVVPQEVNHAPSGLCRGARAAGARIPQQKAVVIRHLDDRGPLEVGRGHALGLDVGDSQGQGGREVVEGSGSAEMGLVAPYPRFQIGQMGQRSPGRLGRWSAFAPTAAEGPDQIHRGPGPLPVQLHRRLPLL